MRRVDLARRSLAISLLGAVMTVGVASHAADGGARAANPTASAAPLPPGTPDDGPMPPGHPMVGGEGGEGDDEAEPANPHGGAVPGMFQPWPDTEEESDRLPAGSIEIEVRNEDDKPVAGASVTLGVVNQSIAKGESRKHLTGDTSGNGKLRFDHLETGSQFAYRVTVPKDGATFAAMPFQLTQQKGRSVVLHMYPVTHDVTQALVVTQTLIYIELKDDRVQIQEAVNLFNFGKTTWVPQDLILPLPENFTALTSQQMMSDQGVDGIDKKGAKLHGTFPPGRHEIEFRYQLPYGGEKRIDFAIGAPPHMAQSRVMAAASQQMSLVVDSFPPGQATTDMQGNRILVTEKEMVRSDRPLDEIRISLKDIPTRGVAHLVASGIAGCVALFGLVLGLNFAGRSAPDAKAKKRDRNRLLEDLEGLERAHAAGDVGPKTYERARREIIDAIARTLA